MADKFLVIRWLLGHTGVLKEIAAIVSGWANDLTLAAKLELVYKVIQALLPVIETFPTFQAKTAVITEAESDADLVEIQAVGVPVPLVITVIAPLVSALIQIILARRNRD
jgi:hypothetical protein